MRNPSRMGAATTKLGQSNFNPSRDGATASRRYAMERQLLRWIVTRPPLGPTKLTKLPSLTRPPRKRVFTLVRKCEACLRRGKRREPL